MKQQDKKMVRNSHGGFGGKTLINRIEAQMDKRRKWLEDFVVRNGGNGMHSAEYSQQRGRYEGLAAALGILRGTNWKEEIRRSNERLGIE